MKSATKRTMTAFGVLLTVGGLSVAGAATPAFAHTPKVSSTCTSLGMVFDNYEIIQAQPGRPGRPAVEEDLEPNIVTITIDGVVHTTDAFGTSYKNSIELDGSVDHTYVVDLDTHDGYDYNTSGETEACITVPPTEPPTTEPPTTPPTTEPPTTPPTTTEPPTTPPTTEPPTTEPPTTEPPTTPPTTEPPTTPPTTEPPTEPTPPTESTPPTEPTPPTESTPPAESTPPTESTPPAEPITEVTPPAEVPPVTPSTTTPTTPSTTVSIPPVVVTPTSDAPAASTKATPAAHQLAETGAAAWTVPAVVGGILAVLAGAALLIIRRFRRA